MVVTVSECSSEICCQLLIWTVMDMGRKVSLLFVVFSVFVEFCFQHFSHLSTVLA